MRVFLCLHIRTSLWPVRAVWSSTYSEILTGGLLHALDLDRVYWDSVLILNTDFVFQPGVFDPIPVHPFLDERIYR